MRGTVTARHALVAEELGVTLLHHANQLRTGDEAADMAHQAVAPSWAVTR